MNGRMLTMTALVLTAAFASTPFGGLLALADGATPEAADEATPAVSEKADGTALDSASDSASDPASETRATGDAVTPTEGLPQPMLPTVELLVGGVPLVVEIASGGQQRYMGLSFRETLEDDAGMLFVYPRARPLTFTMRNTLLPLSIAFIGDDLVVQQIVDMDVGPGQLFDSASPARYALEVNQGWFERNGVGPGALVAMP